MKPKTHKDLVNTLSEELEEDKQLIDSITSYYWKNIKKEVNSLKHLDIEIKNLGNLRVRKSRIKMMEDFYKTKLDKIKKSNRKTLFTEFWENKIKGINYIKKLLEIEDQKREDVKKKRLDYENKKK